jgi:putative ABC transport system permease protein
VVGREAAMIANAIVLALRELRRNVMRSFLTGLGVMIGVSAVVSLVTIGSAATARITSDINKLGSNLLIVTAGSERKGPISASATPLALGDARAAAIEVAGLAELAPSVTRTQLVIAGNTNHSTLVTGTTRAYLEIRAYAIARGRWMSIAEEQSGQRVCVLGATVDRELYRGAESVGSTIRVGRMTCQVIGVLDSKGGSSLGGDQDDLIVMPLFAMQRRIDGTTDVDAIYVGVTNDREVGEVKRRLDVLMRERRGITRGQADDFAVQDLREITATLGSVTGVLIVLLAAIAGVSLLVGGIGIMNVMLVSVTERTREIGLRLAVGARGVQIRLQFLTEAMVLALSGGLLGVAVGLGGSLALCVGLELTFAPSVPVILLALGFSIAVGVTFGYMPARKAANLDPIVALRHE